MATIITETKVIQWTTADGEGRMRVNFNLATDGGGDTSYVVSPGYSTVNIAAPLSSVNLNKIDTWKFENNTAEKAPQIVKTFDTGVNADILTLTVAADDGYDGWVEGPVGS